MKTARLIAAAAAALAVLAAWADDHGTKKADKPSDAPAAKSPKASGGKAASKEVTADVVLDNLKAGNRRFATGKASHPNTDDARRRETVKDGQHPMVTVLSCADSRVPVERVFDQGVGDVFSVRVAGNIADASEIGTIEYGVGHLGTPLVVVLGHTRCGAVTAACEGAEVHGCIGEVVNNIEPAVEAAKAKTKETKGDGLVAAAIEANVWQSVSDLLERSEEMRTKVSDGKVRVVGAIYDLETGKVKWLGQHPDEAKLLASAGATHHGG